MPQLGATGESQKLYLPSTASLPESEQAYVVLSKSIPVGMITDQGDFADDQVAFSYFLLSKAIREWNFTGTDGTVEPITVDNIKLLDYEDYLFLAENFKLGTLETAEKKKSDPLPDSSAGQSDASGSPAI